MIKRIVFLFAIATLALASSCKKETAIQDSTTGTTVQMPSTAVDGDTVNPTPNIGPPPLPESNTPPPANGKYPVMTFEKTDHDFGTIKEGDKVVYVFNFKNTGEADLLISNAVGSCGCTVPEFPKEPVKPGESGKIKVSFNSAGKHGNQQKNVTMATNTKSGKEILNIRASVTPKAESGITGQ